jgi:hypothetical protein
MQESRWKGERARLLNGYKYWKAGEMGVSGVSILIAAKYIDKVFEV